MEGIFIVTFGIILGIIFGVYGFSLMTKIITPLQISHASFNISGSFIIINLSVFFSGLLAALVPAYKGSKISVANQLSRNI